MNNLQKIEHKDIKVLTSKQLSDCYETGLKNLWANFKNHKDRFIEGRDYYKLEKEELKRFKSFPNNIKVADRFAPILYLWTERGALYHAKILNTDKAWETYDLLIDTYFSVKKELTRLELIEIARESEIARLKLESENKLLESQIENDKPLVEGYITFLGTKNCLTMNQVAKNLYEITGLGRNKLFEYLRNKKILDKNNTPKQKYITLKYFLIRQFVIKRKNGNENKSQTLVTPKDADFIHKIVIEEFGNDQGRA